MLSEVEHELSYTVAQKGGVTCLFVSKIVLQAFKSQYV